MATIITNYTTYDLAYYYADLKRLPRLSREERQHLVTGMSGVPTSSAIPLDDTQVKHRLIEGYLPFAKHLAITLCPPVLYQRLLPELIGAANLAVVEATMRCDLSSIMSLDAYIAAYVRGAIKRTIVKDDLLNIPFRARERARAEGTLEQLYAQHRVASLDELMAWFETDEVEEPPIKPIMPTEAAPLRDPRQRTQVETLLSYLSPRAQAILRLRYGLSDDNERRYTTKATPSTAPSKGNAVFMASKGASNCGGSLSFFPILKTPRPLSSASAQRATPRTIPSSDLCLSRSTSV